MLKNLLLAAGAMALVASPAFAAQPSTLVDLTGVQIGTNSNTFKVGSPTCAIVDLGCGASPAANTVNANLGILHTDLTQPATLAAGNGASTINAPFHQTSTTSAVALTTQSFVNGLVITALPTNPGTACIGNSAVTTSTGYCLYPGQSITYNVSTSANIYLIAADTSEVIEVTGN